MVFADADTFVAAVVFEDTFGCTDAEDVDDADEVEFANNVEFAGTA